MIISVMTKCYWINSVFLLKCDYKRFFKISVLAEHTWLQKKSIEGGQRPVKRRPARRCQQQWRRRPCKNLRRKMKKELRLCRDEDAISSEPRSCRERLPDTQERWLKTPNSCFHPKECLDAASSLHVWGADWVTVFTLTTRLFFHAHDTSQGMCHCVQTMPIFLFWAVWSICTW